MRHSPFNEETTEEGVSALLDVPPQPLTLNLQHTFNKHNEGRATHMSSSDVRDVSVCMGNRLVVKKNALPRTQTSQRKGSERYFRVPPHHLSGPPSYILFVCTSLLGKIKKHHGSAPGLMMRAAAIQRPHRKKTRNQKWRLLPVFFLSSHAVCVESSPGANREEIRRELQRVVDDENQCWCAER